MIFLTILLFLTGSNIYGQEPGVIDWEQVYSFINSTMVQDSLRFNLCDNTIIDALPPDEVAGVLAAKSFKKEDRQYFKEQFAMMGKVRWQPGKIKGANVISNENICEVFKQKDGWKKFNEKYGNCLTTYSLPIFTKDFHYCIFYRWVQCGYEEGYGSLDLYKFAHGKWKKVKNYMSGMS